MSREDAFGKAEVCVEEGLEREGGDGGLGVLDAEGEAEGGGGEEDGVGEEEGEGENRGDGFGGGEGCGRRRRYQRGWTGR